MKRQGRFAGRRPGLEEGLREAARGREDAGIPGRRVIMPIRKYNPTSPGSAFPDRADLRRDHDAGAAQAAGRAAAAASGGRNNQGHLTSWWRGGGHKRMYRIIDFKRDKRDIPAKVSTIEYDPNRSARIALLTYADGEKRYILQPIGLKVGDTIVAGPNVDILPGNCAAAEEHPARHAAAQRRAEARARAARSRAAPDRRCSSSPRKASTRR